MIMATRRTYIILLFSTVLVLSACRWGRRSNAHHHLRAETEKALTPRESLGEDVGSTSELWSEEEFDLLAPAMPGYVPSKILERIGYIVSYNHETKCPNWVAWHLTQEHTDVSIR